MRGYQKDGSEWLRPRDKKIVTHLMFFKNVAGKEEPIRNVFLISPWIFFIRAAFSLSWLKQKSPYWDKDTGVVGKEMLESEKWQKDLPKGSKLE